MRADPVIDRLRRANPVEVRPLVGAPRLMSGITASPGDPRLSAGQTPRGRADRRPPARGGRRWRRAGGLVVPAVSVIVVLLVAVAFLSLRGGGSPGSSTSSRGEAVKLVYLAEPSPQVPHLTRAALQREVTVMRGRLRALGVSPGASVRVVGRDEIVVKLPDDQNTARAESLIGTTAELYFYDWEASALTPNGKTVASQLQTRAPTAMKISQGTSSAAAGYPNAGSMSLYEAVKLASEQPKSVSSHNARLGPQYYMFGAPQSAACAAKASQTGTTPARGQHCLLAGPDDGIYTTSRHQAIKNLATQLPPGVNASDGEVLVVQQGTVVLQAANPTASTRVRPFAPQAQYYVLKDNVALRGSDITHPRASTDQGGNPDVQFGFNSHGKTAFTNATAQIAHRGQDISTLGLTLDQHFAVALDNQLLTVPSIDFKAYPDGITGANGADITASLTTTSAKQLAAELRLGALPINLRLLDAKAQPPAHK